MNETNIIGKPRVIRVHFTSPFRLDINLGKAYNQAMKKIGEYDWMCFTDYDVLFLTPNSKKIIINCCKHAPEGTGLLTCFTNRIHPISKGQLLHGLSENSDIREHIKIAIEQELVPLRFSMLNYKVSGFLMCINKKVWEALGGFSETGEALGVDTDFCSRLLERKFKIYRMNQVYVWHTYRLIQGIDNKEHLKK